MNESSPGSDAASAQDGGQSETSSLSEAEISPPDRRPVPLRVTTRGATVFIAMIVGVWMLNYARSILIPLVASLLLGALFKPLVRWLHRTLKIPEPVTAVVIVAMIFGLLTGPAWTMASPAGAWLSPSQEAIENIQNELGAFREPINRIGQMWTNVSDSLGLAGGGGGAGGETTETVQVESSDSPPMLGTVATTTGAAITGLIMTLILTLFMLSVGDGPANAIVCLAPSDDQRQEAMKAIHEIERDVSRYLVTLTLINIGVALVTGSAMWLIGINNYIMLGLVAGLFNFVPYIGAFAAFTVIGLVSLVSFDEPLWILAGPAAFIVINTIEAYIISPMIYGERLSIHPLMILLSLIFFGWVWGVAGALMGVPLLVCIKIVCSHVVTLRPIAIILESPRECAMGSGDEGG